MENTTTDIETLRRTYCPPLDDSLFYAVALDYDVTKPDENKALVKTLDELKEAATINEAADADLAADVSGSVRDQTDRSHTTPEDHKGSHHVTSATSEQSTLNLGVSEQSLGEDLEHLSEADQRKYLNDLFPGTDKARIIDILTTSGSLHSAIDELLNLAFLSAHGEETSDEHRYQAKGVDSFAEELRPDRGRKRRNKKKNRTTESSRANSSSSYGADTAQLANVWASASGDVEFICSRTTLSVQAVTSLYHRNAADLAETIRELADREKVKLPPFDAADPIMQMQVAELKEDFSDVSVSRIQALLHLARNIPSATYELLEAMVSRPLDDGSTSSLQGAVQYAPVKLGEDRDAAWYTVGSGSANQTNYGADHGYAANRAFGQASAAARRAKSDRLMGGAAAYYSSVGHEHIKIAKAQSSAAADALVGQQSTRTKIDLHGVSVADAVRIANFKTQSWWEGLGDAKYATGGGGPVRAGFQIVTGVGTHSRNNAPRIGPAVAKALVREGWRVEVGHGEMYVIGKARK